VGTKVEGNTVFIDDVSYELKVQPNGSYKVIDEYKQHIGNFSVRGRAVEAEDYGVELAHPIVKIGKLWVEAQVAAKDTAPKAASGPLCRVVTHEPLTDDASVAKAAAYFAWLKTQPGVVSTVLSHDKAKQKTISVTVWQTQEALAALKPNPDLPTPKAISVDLLPVVG